MRDPPLHNCFWVLERGTHLQVFTTLQELLVFFSI